LLVGTLSIVAVVDGIKVPVGFIEEIIDEQCVGSGNDQINKNDRRNEDDQDLTVIVNKDGWIHDQRQDHAYQCTAQVSVMAYIVLWGSYAVDTEQYKQEGEDPTRNKDRKDKKVYVHVRENRNRGKHHSANRSRRAYGTIVSVISVNQQGKQSSAQKAGKVNDKEIKTAQGYLNQAAEGKEAEHIEDEVYPTDVQEAGCDQALIVFVYKYPIYLEFVTIEKQAI